MSPEGDIKTYLVCPSTPHDGEIDKIVDQKVLATFMGLLGFQVWQNCGNRCISGPDLIIVHPDWYDPVIGIEDLRLLLDTVLPHRHKPTRLLYLDPRLNSDDAPSYTGDEDILIFSNCAGGPINRLKDFISAQVDVSKWIEKNDPLKWPDLANLLCQSLFKSQAKPTACTKRLVKFCSHYRLSPQFRRAICLLNTQRPLDFVYGLICLADSYDKLEHEINARGRHRFSLFPSDNDFLSKMRAILDAATDLLGSLKARRDFAREPEKYHKTILLVDDNPEAIKIELFNIVEKLLPKFTIHIWNTRKNNPGNILQTIEHYTSIVGDGERGKIKLSRYDGAGTKEKPESIGDIIRTARFVLVDLLLHDGVEERNRGASVIRGLRRLYNDLSDERQPSATEFVAISRADDITKIQHAFRSGAAGYVLKNRLLSLPGVLRNIRYSVVDSIGSLHRNFNQLYSLPNQTIGLLHTISIPRLNFRTGSPISEVIKPLDLKMAELLAEVPKTDLHLHVGSCMSPEFLVEAALVMLAYYEDKDREQLLNYMKYVTRFWSGDNLMLRLSFLGGFAEAECDQLTAPISFSMNAQGVGEGYDPVREFAEKVKCRICKALNIGQKEVIKEVIRALRSLLHRQLRVPDHVSNFQAVEEVKKKSDVELFMFAILNGTLIETTSSETLASCTSYNKKIMNLSNLLRLFLLFLASRNHNFTIDCPRKNLLLSGSSIVDAEKLGNVLTALNEDLYQQQPEQIPPVFSCRAFNTNGWGWPEKKGNVAEEPLLKVSAGNDTKGFLFDIPSLADRPIEYLCASGTRSRNLIEYLAGCEYSGAEHLQHPYLMHRYARQTLKYLKRHGVIYAELRAAATGFVNHMIGFKFTDVCRCLSVAFSNAQKNNLKEFQKNPPDKLLGRMCWPVKVNLILTGKRHKPMRQMMMETAAMVVLQTTPLNDIPSAREYRETRFSECKMVGFDLAGQEYGFRPEMFRTQFESLTRLHIPITAHAGENASAEYVAGAILDLHARRLGHGLTLEEDPQLMHRAREEGICIELCPVSNFQTNTFVESKGDFDSGRVYPLKALLKNGNAVCLNTDNPIISNTNIIKEYFQASFAYDKEGLPLWDALCIMRMGFIHSFMSMPERRAMLELVDQILFDLFTREDVISLLRELPIVHRANGTAS